jgi:hypothetical protein
LVFTFLLVFRFLVFLVVKVVAFLLGLFGVFQVSRLVTSWLLLHNVRQELLIVHQLAKIGNQFGINLLSMVLDLRPNLIKTEARDSKLDTLLSAFHNYKKCISQSECLQLSKDD